MLNFRCRISDVVALGLLMAVTGCGGGATPVGVSGTVTWDGQPLPEGTISFEPISKTAGQRRDVAIENGAFELPTEEGVLSGLEFNVVVRAFRKTGRKYPNASSEASYEETIQFIPTRYNTATTLTTTISPIEEENQLNFDLVSE